MPTRTVKLGKAKGSPTFVVTTPSAAEIQKRLDSRFNQWIEDTFGRAAATATVQRQKVKTVPTGDALAKFQAAVNAYDASAQPRGAKSAKAAQTVDTLRANVKTAEFRRQIAAVINDPAALEALLLQEGVTK
jgi:hypothetical protein